MLTTAISIDNLARGMAGTVFIAFLSGLTNTAYTATQYALFTSIMTLPGKLIGGFSGVIVDWLQSEARNVPALAALLDAVGAAPSSAATPYSSSTPPCSACRPSCWRWSCAGTSEKETPPSATEGGGVRSATGCQPCRGNLPIPERGVGLPSRNRQVWVYPAEATKP